MPAGPPPDVELLRERVAAVAPELADAPFEVRSGGWDSVALDVADRWIFKFPRTPELVESLRREQAILALVGPRLALPVPRPVLHEDEAGVFSRHEKIPGSGLLAHEYATLDEDQRQALADTLAGVYVALHEIPLAEAQAAGARPVFELNPPETIRAAARHNPLLADYAEETIAGFLALPADRIVFGQFDGHGWNMAFDHERGVLNGLFDFADAGIGALHRDLCYPAWLHAGLCARTTRAYVRISGYPADPRAAVLHNAMLRFSEYADGTLGTVTEDPDGSMLDFARQSAGA